MRYVNNTSKVLTFEVCGRPYKVAPRGVCDIEDRFDYVVRSRRLLLTPEQEVAASPAKEEPEAIAKRGARKPPIVDPDKVEAKVEAKAETKSGGSL